MSVPGGDYICSMRLTVQFVPIEVFAPGVRVRASWPGTLERPFDRVLLGQHGQARTGYPKEASIAPRESRRESRFEGLWRLTSLLACRPEPSSRTFV